jgi:hypothetical protein
MPMIRRIEPPSKSPLLGGRCDTTRPELSFCRQQDHDFVADRVAGAGRVRQQVSYVIIRKDLCLLASHRVIGAMNDHESWSRRTAVQATPAVPNVERHLIAFNKKLSSHISVRSAFWDADRLLLWNRTCSSNPTDPAVVRSTRDSVIKSMTCCRRRRAFVGIAAGR